jgi:cell division septal protein FtsQ
MSSFDATDRFLRPADVARIRRNQNRIQVQRLLVVARNVAFGILVLLAGAWIYRHTQSDKRFAVKTVEIAGAGHTSRAELDAATSRYVGANLFQIDIEGVQRDLRALPWVSRVDIEKKLPDTLRIRIVERTPVALALTLSGLRYVDESGVPFAALSPAVGDPDLLLISGATIADLARAAELVRELRTRDPLLYSRISEIRTIAPDGFALFDRDLGALVYANRQDISEKFRSLYGVVQAEGLTRGSIQYADLRFNDRIVIKPRWDSGFGIRDSEAPESRITNPESLD